MRRTTVAILLAAAVAVPVQAQNPGCAGASTQTADLCEKTADLFSYMIPQLGTSLVGGSHTLGIGSTLGGFPHFAIALRGNAVRGDLPDVGTMNVSPFARSSDPIATNSQIIGLPGLDFAVGIWKGFPLGVSRIGGVDLIGNVTFVPDIEDDGFSITAQDGNTKFGLGARIGLLEQSLVVPGVSFSWMRRDVPRLDLAAEAGDDQLAVRGLNIQTTSWRLAAQKNLLLIQLGAGIGRDSYDGTALLEGEVNDPAILLPGNSTSFSARTDVAMTRTSYYGTLGFNLFIAKIVAEIGQVSGGELTTYNTFAEAADKSRMYGTLGVRISF